MLQKMQSFFTRVHPKLPGCSNPTAHEKFPRFFCKKSMQYQKSSTRDGDGIRNRRRKRHKFINFPSDLSPLAQAKLFNPSDPDNLHLYYKVQKLIRGHFSQFCINSKKFNSKLKSSRATIFFRENTSFKTLHMDENME